jgi:ABC-type thiamine transport system ATPase subunit
VTRPPAAPSVTRPAAAARPAASTAALKVEALSVRYGSTTGVVDVDLEVARGEAVALLGPSGSGKSTVLKAVAGFLRPSEGRVLLDGRDVTDLTPAKRGIGVVVQSYALFPHMKVADNVAFGLRAHRLPRAQIRARVEEVLEQVGMAAYGARLPRELSGGQQQRVAIARALAIRPPLLLLDEPLSARGRRRIADQRRRRPGHPAGWPPLPLPVPTQPGATRPGDCIGCGGHPSEGGDVVVTALVQDDHALTTTTGHIAAANLNAQVNGLTAQFHRARSAQEGTALLTVSGPAALVDLLLLRGQVLGRVVDYERAAELAEALVRDVPDDGTARLARAPTRSTFHRFPEALADLDAAARHGASQAALDAERAASSKRWAAPPSPSRCAEPRRSAVPTSRRWVRSPCSKPRGQVAEAECLFTAARHHYRGVSPFPHPVRGRRAPGARLRTGGGAPR